MKKSSESPGTDSIDELDQLLWSQTPIVTVPNFRPHLALAERGHRYLISANGVWLELVRPWLYLLTPVSLSSVRLPAGALRESLSMPLKVPPSLLREFWARAREKSDIETAALVVYSSSTGNFSLVDVEVIDASADHINYRYPRLADDEEVVLDMHTHARGPAHFSEDKDDIDDGEMIQFSLVIGNCDRELPSCAMRLCALGKFIDLPAPVEVFI